MNDFTKEELQAIIVSIHNLRFNHNPNDEFYAILHEKIADMIDNFPDCKHRIDLHHYNEKGNVVDFYTGIYKCMYCNIFFKLLYENDQVYWD